MKNCVLDILNQCIEELKNTTEDEFIEKKRALGILDKEYNINKYVNEDVEIILPKYEIIEEYMSIKIDLHEDGEFVWDNNFYELGYNETVDRTILAA